MIDAPGVGVRRYIASRLERLDGVEQGATQRRERMMAGLSQGSQERAVAKLGRVVQVLQHPAQLVDESLAGPSRLCVH